jgi:hypothetical protein
MRYAANTGVSVERSKGELDTLLAKSGAQQRAMMNDELRGLAVVVFAMGGRQVKLSMSFPTYASMRVQSETDPPRGWRSWSAAQRDKWLRAQIAQAERQRWRGLLLCVKAKLELIADGSSTLEREFLSDIVLPDGRTVGETVLPRIAEAYNTGIMPPMLPGYTGASS